MKRDGCALARALIRDPEQADLFDDGTREQTSLGGARPGVESPLQEMSKFPDTAAGDWLLELLEDTDAPDSAFRRRRQARRLLRRRGFRVARSFSDAVGICIDDLPFFAGAAVPMSAKQIAASPRRRSHLKTRYRSFDRPSRSENPVDNRKAGVR